MLPLMRSRSSSARQQRLRRRGRRVTWLGMPRLDLVEHADRRADLARRAVAALVAVVLDEGGLHRMQLVRRAQAFDGGDLGALVHHRQRQAGVDAPAVDDHRAGAALAVVAALLGAGQVQVLAQRVEQRGAGVEFELVALAVDAQRHLGRAPAPASARAAVRRRRLAPAAARPAAPPRSPTARRRSAGRAASG